MRISIYTGGFVQTNGYLIESPSGNLLIDAPAGIADWAAARGVRVDDVLLTHQHFDHVEDAAALREDGARLHALKEFSLDRTLESLARGWGLPISVAPYEIDRRFDMASPLSVADLEIRLSPIPGHSSDSVSFYFPAHGIVFPGDTLLSGAIGRTDLPGGSHSQLLDGISRHLLTLPPETRVFPGHGPATTIGAESAKNPYLG